jgi:flagellar motor switch protein FliN/FliY
MIKKRDVALETTAELFLTAFNGEIQNHGTLERVAVDARPDPKTRWFRQIFTSLTDFELLVGVSSSASEALPGDVPELLENAFERMARALQTVAHSIVSCGAFKEEAAPQDAENIAYELRRESVRFGRVILSVPESILNFLSSVIHPAAAPEDVPAGKRSAPLHLDALLNVDLPVSISFGTTEMALADVLKLTTGSIVEFNHMLNEPVSVVVNDCLVARGDVVVVDGNYGVRISEVLARPPR